MNQVTRLAARRYITAKMRESDYSDFPNPYRQLRLVPQEDCQHITTVCDSPTCLNSWSLDWQMFLSQTAAGRAIINKFNLSERDLQVLESPSFRSIYPRSDPFRA